MDRCQYCGNLVPKGDMICKECRLINQNDIKKPIHLRVKRKLFKE